MMRYLLGFLTLLLSCSAYSNTTSSSLDTQTLTLQKSYLQAIDCRAPGQLSDALKQAIKSSNDLFVKGNHASVFEEIMMNNPACFIQALSQLPEQSCRQVQANYIDETFFYPRDEIKKALSSAGNFRESCLAG